MVEQLEDSGSRQEYATGAQREPQTGKGRFDLVSPVALMRLAQHYERGARKYSEANMRKGLPLSRFLDSALRHLVRFQAGDRSEDHLAAAMWNVAELIHTGHRVATGTLPRELDDLSKVLGEAVQTTEVTDAA